MKSRQGVTISSVCDILITGNHCLTETSSIFDGNGNQCWDGEHTVTERTKVGA